MLVFPSIKLKNDSICTACRFDNGRLDYIFPFFPYRYTQVSFVHTVLNYRMSIVFSFSHTKISSLFTNSIALLRMLFIFCSQSIISVDLSFSVTFSFLAKSFTSRRKSCWACSSVSARREWSLPEVSRL